VDSGWSRRSDSSSPPPQLQHREAIGGQHFDAAFHYRPYGQAFQPPTWEQASHLAALLIHSPACGPSNELGERSATKTRPSLLGGGLQRKLDDTCRCPYGIFLFGHGEIRPEQEELVLMRTLSCCPSLYLYDALLGLPDLCFEAITAH